MRDKIRIVKKLNNAGITLVEVIAAMAILAIVVVPFVHSFVTAAQTNKKAREQYYATTIAEDIMELWENVNLGNEIAYIQGLVPEGGANPVTENSGKYTINMGSDILAGYVGESFVNDGYSAEIVLDPSEYSAINSKQVADIITFDSKTDGIYMMSEGYDDAEIKKIAKSAGKSETTVKSGTTRDITINVSPNTLHGVKFVKVSVKIVYHYGTMDVPMPSVMIYNNTVKEGAEVSDLKNVYLLYTPLDDIICHENIYVYNDADVEFNLFLLRQNGTTSFKVPVSLVDDNSTSEDPRIKIRTNLFNEPNFYDADKAFNVASDMRLDVTYKPRKDSSMDYADDKISICTPEGLTLKGTYSGESRIYKMKVIVSKDGNNLVDISGAKINK